MNMINSRAMTFCLVALTGQLLYGGGTIKGTVSFDGRAPKPRAIRMGADPVCAAQHKEPAYSEAVVVNSNSTLKNVLVSIEKGLEGQSYDVPEEPLILDQRGCRYEPHVWGIMAGQTVQILNSDPTLHNLHSLSKVNTQFNFAMPKIVKKKAHVFKKSEDIFKIKCDVHPWMGTYVGVFTHPFYSVTDDTGAFQLANVPPGTYTIRAWHESKRLPAQTMTVTVKDGEAVIADFTFKGPPPKEKK